MDSKITTYYTMDSKGLHFYYKVRDALILAVKVVSDIAPLQ